MSRTISTKHPLLGGLAVVALIGTACGGESTQEAALERLIESESGEDIDLDFDGDGGFSVQTEDGEFSMNIDEDGNVQFQSDEGSGEFSSDGDGGGELTFEGEDGSASVDVDEDGSFVVTDEDGNVISGASSDDGTFTVEGEDGSASFSSGAGIPEEWPTDVPRPDGLSDITNTYFNEAGAISVVVNGIASADTFAAYAAALQSAGFSEDTEPFESETFSSASYARGEEVVTMTSTPTTGGVQISIIYTSS
ncbi:MAG: hypothetical protein ACE37B_20525 [Ilumatobacter sp.]|uniref:hypothetical protein n=1 Tax=Ilumatobacter sp. TaxID=1967498 RepID=UPI0039193282